MSTYTKQDIARILDTTVRTVTEDSRYLTNEGYIKPIQINGAANQYSQEDLEIFKQIREHCNNNFNRKSFLPKKEVEIVAHKNSKSSLRSIKQEIKSIEKFRQVFENFSNTDPFYDYEQLQRCADSSWYLTTVKLAAIINKKPKTFRHLQRFSYQGFVLDRQPEKEGNTYIWSVNANQ